MRAKNIARLVNNFRTSCIQYFIQLRMRQKYHFCCASIEIIKAISNKNVLFSSTSSRRNWSQMCAKWNTFKHKWLTFSAQNCIKKIKLTLIWPSRLFECKHLCCFCIKDQNYKLFSKKTICPSNDLIAKITVKTYSNIKLFWSWYELVGYGKGRDQSRGQGNH